MVGLTLFVCLLCCRISSVWKTSLSCLFLFCFSWGQGRRGGWDFKQEGKYTIISVTPHLPEAEGIFLYVPSLASIGVVLIYIPMYYSSLMKDPFSCQYNKLCTSIWYSKNGSGGLWAQLSKKYNRKTMWTLPRDTYCICSATKPPRCLESLPTIVIIFSGDLHNWVQRRLIRMTWDCFLPSSLLVGGGETIGLRHLFLFPFPCELHFCLCWMHTI